ncbi:helix-turn-helix domain-containing protein [Naasia sp. SYSU D00057]|uniref:helix-turn-helix domain-containing protein n=1 Tax=Naasia sp. SYSU D00057 TaxID=2817380 RepID=UPI001B3083CF|nr:helix-turn-helix domain-containing protein [Naasia sp. SYSU D00057]
MRTTRADAILHPQRLAILRALAAGPGTAKKLARALPDIPQATLYRHLGVLAAAGLVAAVEERAVRGTLERTFALTGSAVVSADEVAGASRDDLFRHFGTFLAGLLGEYGRYLEKGEVDLAADGVGFREHVLRLSDEELPEFLAELREVIARWSDRPPEPGRTPRLLATVTLPTIDSSGAPE